MHAPSFTSRLSEQPGSLGSADSSMMSAGPSSYHDTTPPPHPASPYHAYPNPNRDPNYSTSASGLALQPRASRSPSVALSVQHQHRHPYQQPQHQHPHPHQPQREQGRARSSPNRGGGSTSGTESSRRPHHALEPALTHTNTSGTTGTSPGTGGTWDHPRRSSFRSSRHFFEDAVVKSLMYACHFCFFL